MANLIKGSKEWFEAKAEARKELDLKLSLGIPHGQKIAKIGATPGFVPSKPTKAPKAPKKAKPPKAAK